MAAAGAIWCRHSTDGGIQWLWVNPCMCSIGRPDNAPRIVPLHPHGSQICQQFACVFCCGWFVVCTKSKTMLWLKYEPSYINFWIVLINLFTICMLWAPAVDDGCRFGHHFRWRASDSSKTRVAVKKIITFCHYFIELNKTPRHVVPGHGDLDILLILWG